MGSATAQPAFATLALMSDVVIQLCMPLTPTPAPPFSGTCPAAGEAAGEGAGGDPQGGGAGG
jgi:hypothetical protein